MGYKYDTYGTTPMYRLHSAANPLPLSLRGGDPAAGSGSVAGEGA
jgi:hypothetical protein